MRINKNVFKFIENELYNYDDIKKELTLYKEEILEGENKPDVAVQGGIGDKTANKAVKMVSSKFVLQSEKAIHAIEKSLVMLDGKYRLLFKLKYQDCLPWQEVILEMGVSDRSYFRLRRELVTVVGQELGIINAM